MMTRTRKDKKQGSTISQMSGLIFFAPKKMLSVPSCDMKKLSMAHMGKVNPQMLWISLAQTIK